MASFATLRHHWTGLYSLQRLARKTSRSNCLLHARESLYSWFTKGSTVLGLCFFCSFWRAYVASGRCCIICLWHHLMLSTQRTTWEHHRAGIFNSYSYRTSSSQFMCLDETLKKTWRYTQGGLSAGRLPISFYVQPLTTNIMGTTRWFTKKTLQKSKTSLLMLLKTQTKECEEYLKKWKKRACLRTCSLSSSQSFDIKIVYLWRANVSRQSFDFIWGCFWRANVSSVKHWDDYIYSSLYIIVPDVVGEAGASTRQMNRPKDRQCEQCP